ncbi:STM4012 family radical SAM protein [Oceanobacter mangrovi]|uniref:STM4012 family radical SAM protein n=1 Tax=Oceanobacter mangrovi TaxID=2862510 RepID=UPI001C8F1D5A|nr:STM4012 family radical SAM protein [Oceanobacter mangrovi]
MNVQTDPNTATDAETRLQQLLEQQDDYLNYVYSYPHKTAYRELSPAVDLSQAWANEVKQQLFLYVHVPFCEMRCGYCNLFTLSRPPEALVAQYLDTLQRQARISADWLGKARFEQLAFGGGTPTYLTPVQLERVFDILRTELNWQGTQASVEVSPATATVERLALLKQQQVSRISIGIESFVDHDLKALGRPQQHSQVEQALHNIRQQDFDCLNIDLIYGNHQQSAQDWQDTLQRAVAWQPQEIFVYPLYVRPLTGLGKRASRLGEITSDRHLAYRQARDYLLQQGYQQLSMRQFVKPKSEPGLAASNQPGQSYRCQEDGMIGLGPGARSYTSQLHYSGHYAVAQPQIQQLIEDYVNSSDDDFRVARYGFELDANEQRHRFVLLGLLQCDGLSRAHYRQRFGEDVLQHFPQLLLLQQQGWIEISTQQLRPTAAGIEQADLIGHWLFSDRVRERMQGWDWQ